MKKLTQLHTELLEFKQTDKFIQFGFGKGGPHNSWLLKVQSGRACSSHNLSLRYAELEQLGFAYVRLQGNEDSYTIELNEKFNALKTRS